MLAMQAGRRHPGYADAKQRVGDGDPPKILAGHLGGQNDDNGAHQDEQVAHPGLDASV